MAHENGFPPNVLANGGLQPMAVAQHPEVINLIAPEALQANEEPAPTIAVYMMQAFVGSIIGEFDRALGGDIIAMKYEISRLAVQYGLTGKHQVIFAVWRQEGGQRTSRLQLERVHLNMMQFPLHAVLLAAAADGEIPEQEDDPSEEILEDDDEEGQLPNDEILQEQDDEMLDAEGQPPNDEEQDDEMFDEEGQLPNDEIPQEQGDEMFDEEGQLPDDGWFEDHNLTTGDIIRFSQEESIIITQHTPVFQELGVFYTLLALNRHCLEEQVAYIGRISDLFGAFEIWYDDHDGQEIQNLVGNFPEGRQELSDFLSSVAMINLFIIPLTPGLQVLILR